MTVTVNHISNGFPGLRDIPVSGKGVPWTQYTSSELLTAYWPSIGLFAMTTP